MDVWLSFEYYGSIQRYSSNLGLERGKRRIACLVRCDRIYSFVSLLSIAYPLIFNYFKTLLGREREEPNLIAKTSSLRFSFSYFKRKDFCYSIPISCMVVFVWWTNCDFWFIEELPSFIWNLFLVSIILIFLGHYKIQSHFSWQKRT